MADLFDARWKLEALTGEEIGPFVPERLSDAEKEEVWKRYREGRPVRVPMMLGVNNRVVLLDRRIDPAGLTFEATFCDPAAMLKSQLLWTYVSHQRYHLFCDSPTELPEVWRVGLSFQNIYEAQFLGCPVNFYAHQVPDTTPIYRDENKEAVFEVDITQPLEREPFRTMCRMMNFLVDYVKDKTFLGRPIVIEPPGYVGSDGPLTVAMNIRGSEILLDMVDDPEYADRLFRFIVDAALNRRKAVIERFNLPKDSSWMADDSIALIGVEQYRQMVLPHHRYWYESIGSEFGRRSIHLCGDATRHFPVLKEELGVTGFDTGFPVDFSWLRKTLGPQVEISGGVEVGTLISGTPEQVYRRTREILHSGIMDGGRFVFREANNLPPNVPWSNLAAMYKAVQDFGRY